MKGKKKVEKYEQSTMGRDGEIRGVPWKKVAVILSGLCSAQLQSPGSCRSFCSWYLNITSILCQKVLDVYI
jgi:hypothetical protein